VKTLVVLGATGLMGRRIVALAERDLPDVRILRASRRSQPGERTRQIDLARPESLSRQLAEADCLINAVGPYDYDPKPLLEACHEASCHYVDLAEAPAFCADAADAARALALRGDGVGFVIGASTVPGLIDLLVQRWSEDRRVASIDARLSMGSRNPTSPTLLYSLIRTLRGRTPSGERYFASVSTRQSPDGRMLAYGRYPFPSEGDGILAGDRRIPIAFHVGFDRRALVRALALGRPLLERLPEGLLGRLSRAAHPLFRGISRLGTTRGCLEVIARDAAGAELGATAVLAQREGLDIPAAPAVWAARALLRDPNVEGGVMRLADLVTIGEARDWLDQRGYEVVESSEPAG